MGRLRRPNYADDLAAALDGIGSSDLGQERSDGDCRSLDLRYRFAPFVLHGSLADFLCPYFGDQPLHFTAYYTTFSEQFRSAVVPDNLACAGLRSLIRGLWRHPIQAD
mmetsp:Transcript_52598/g.138012  ORF Transcript_52598/g.138012 Transcript_52598/m.138012 type:complete len:108 (-) Transcript_52598:137-460(-)